MNILNLIIIILFFYLMYTFLFLKKKVEKFSDNLDITSSKNLLPKFGNNPIIPFYDCINCNGILSMKSGSLVQKSNSKGNCYTNNFMFTPVCLARNQFTGLHNSYVFSSECFNNSNNEVEVEMWIFGLNSGRRHFVDNSYQDFISVKKKIPKKTKAHVELLYKPRHSLTEYIAVRLDVNTANSEVNWKQLQLSMLNTSKLKSTSTKFSKDFTDGESGAISILASKCSNNYSPCTYPALQQYGTNNEKGMLLDYNGHLQNKLGTTSPDSCASKGQSACKGGCAWDTSLEKCHGKVHCCRNDINSAFPLKWSSNQKFRENFIKLDFEFNLYQSVSNGPVGFGSKIFYDIVKHFIRFNGINSGSYDTKLFDDTNNFYLYLLKVSQTSPINFGIFDITLNKTGNKLGKFKIENGENNLNIGGNKFEGTNVDQGKHFFPSSTVTSYSNRDEYNVIKLSLNIYYKLPVNKNLINTDKCSASKNNLNTFGCKIVEFIKYNIKEFMDTVLYNSTNYGGDNPKFFITSQTDKSYPFLNNNNIIIKMKSTEQGNIVKCGIEVGNKVCTTTATMEDGASNIQGTCSCTHCNNADSVKKIVSGESNITDYKVLPGQGTCNMCNMRSNLTCLNKSKAQCKGNCNWNVSTSKCETTCSFSSPLNYKTKKTDVAIKISNLEGKNYYSSICPLPNDLNINSSNINVINTNECQIYYDSSNPNKLHRSKIKIIPYTVYSHRTEDLELPLKTWNSEGNSVRNSDLGSYTLYAKLYKGEHVTYMTTGTTKIPVSIILNPTNPTKSQIIRVDPGSNMLKYFDTSNSWKTSTDVFNTNIGKTNTKAHIQASLLFGYFMK
jgi:hypothetical protein